MTIYDNGYKLHQYALNCEPVHFKNTMFLVDKFHWQGYVPAATPWMAKDHWMLEVNKQANTGLQKTYCIHPKAANEAWYIIG